MEKKQKLTTKKVLMISLNSLFYLIIIVLLVFSVANIKVKKENDIANIFGRGFLSVQSNSMLGDQKDSFEKGDLLFVKMLDEESAKKLKDGDIVTFFDMSEKIFISHRVVDVNLTSGYLTTQADHNLHPDKFPTPPLESHNFDQVLAQYTSKATGLGNALDYLQSSTGFALFVVLPVVFILAFEGIMLGRNILQLNRAKMEEKYAQEKEEQVTMLESEKEKLRQEILAELKKEKDIENKSK